VFGPLRRVKFLVAAPFIVLMLFVISQLVLIGLGSIPLHLWASFRNRGLATGRDNRLRGGGRKTAPATT